MNNEQIIAEQFTRLPEVLKKALSTLSWQASVKEIADNNHLSPEQAEGLERETMFILYGFQEVGDYLKNLVTEVPLEEDVVMRIAAAVDEKVLSPIAEFVKKEESVPVIITKETKEKALADLTRRRMAAEGTSVPASKPAKPAVAPAPAPKAIHNDLPMVEEGEKQG